MKEFIEKLINKLKKTKDQYTDDCFVQKMMAMEEAIKIVNQLAEEYKGGWISVDDRLPDIEHISGVSETVLVTTNNKSIFTAEYHGNGKWLDDVADWNLEVVAWQPLPAPYKEGVTENE